MIQDLDLTLRKLLEDAAVPPSMAGIDISFKTPDKAFTFNQATVNLFFYGVHENRVLRDPVPILEPVAGVFVRRTPPLRADCDYLVTAFSKKQDAAAIEEEHEILAKSLIKLSRFPLIPTGYLQNSLVGQPFPVQMWAAQTDDSKGLAEFWSALGASPRSTFHLTVTIAMDLQVAVPEGPPVVTKQIVLDDDLDFATPGESTFGIGGVVRDALTTVGIAGATVTLDATRATTTDADGRFRFSGLGAGSHTLTATAPGFTTGTKPITVPAAAINNYDIDLAP
jgi:Pvc16 N-terminal domain/Carboxypeptidase regulatory-like domain